MPATRKNRLYKKMKRRGKKNSYKSKRKTMHKRKSGKNISRRHRGGNLLWPAYGAPANGVSPVNIKIPEMAYNIKGGNTNAVNPFVGKAWGAPIQDWPGVSGPHDGNHYAMNTYDVQPEMEQISERTTSNMRGGRRTRRKRAGESYGEQDYRKAYGTMEGDRTKKSTTSSPADDYLKAYSGGKRHRRVKKGGFGLGLNVFSQLGNDLTNGYRQLLGQPAAPSPLPYEDQVFYGNRAQDNLNYLKTSIH